MDIRGQERPFSAMRRAWALALLAGAALPTAGDRGPGEFLALKGVGIVIGQEVQAHL